MNKKNTTNEIAIERFKSLIEKLDKVINLLCIEVDEIGKRKKKKTTVRERNVSGTHQLLQMLIKEKPDLDGETMKLTSWFQELEKNKSTAQHMPYFIKNIQGFGMYTTALCERMPEIYTKIQNAKVNQKTTKLFTARRISAL